MCEVIDQMIEEIKLPEYYYYRRKDNILRILDQAKYHITYQTPKYDPIAPYEERIAQKLNYYRGQVRIWKTTELRELQNRKALNFRILKDKIINELESKFEELHEKIRHCTTIEEFDTIKHEVKQLFA